MPKAGAGCWTNLAKAAGLDATKAPDCAAGYLTDKTALAKARCEADGKPGAKVDAKCLAKEMKVADEQHFDAGLVCELFGALDGWLCGGGFLPHDWSR